MDIWGASATFARRLTYNDSNERNAFRQSGGQSLNAAPSSFNQAVLNMSVTSPLRSLTVQEVVNQSPKKLRTSCHYDNDPENARDVPSDMAKN